MPVCLCYERALDGVALVNYSPTVNCGSEFYYTAVMYSSTIGRNGPVKFSVTDMNNNSTNIATIGESIGYFKALKAGPVRIHITYDNAPWVWIWNINIILPTSGYEVPYNTYLWNYSPVVYSTNCYAYSLNNQVYPKTNNLWFMQPGEASGYSLTRENLTAERVEQYVRSDSTSLNFIFERVNKNDKCAAGSYKVALVIAPGVDYHWYRENPDGTWSHKPGSGNVIDEDASGNVIFDPETADRTYPYADYSIFVGFFRITPLNNFYSNGRSVALYDQLMLDKFKADLPEVNSALQIEKNMTYSDVTDIIGLPQRVLTFGVMVVEYELKGGKSLIVEYVNQNGHFVVEDCSVE